MVIVIKELLDNYEKDIGEIPLTPDIRERHKKIFGKHFLYRQEMLQLT
jgi:hypothetical protein